MDKKTAFQHGFLCKLAEDGLTPQQVFSSMNMQNTTAMGLIKAAGGGAFLAAAAGKGLGYLESGFGLAAQTAAGIVRDYGLPALILGPTLAGAGLGVLSSKMSSPDNRDIARLKQLQLLREYRRANEILSGNKSDALRI